MIVVCIITGVSWFIGVVAVANLQAAPTAPSHEGNDYGEKWRTS